MSWKFTFVTSSSWHAFLAITLTSQLITFIRNDSFNVAIAAFTRSIQMLREAEKSFRTTITKRSSVTFLAVARHACCRHVAASSKVVISLRTWAWLASFIRMTIKAFSTSVTSSSAGVVTAVLKMFTILKVPRQQTFKLSSYQALSRLLLTNVTSSITFASHNASNQFFKYACLSCCISPSIKTISGILTRVTSKTFRTFTLFNSQCDCCIIIAVNWHSTVHRYVGETRNKFEYLKKLFFLHQKALLTQLVWSLVKWWLLRRCAWYSAKRSS